MNRAGFWPAVLAGALLAALGGLCFHALVVLVTPERALRSALTLSAAAWIAGLALSAPGAAGRVVVPLAWLGLATVLALGSTGLAKFVVLHATLAWLVRVLLHHRHLLAALADFALTALALAAGVVAWHHGAGITLAGWSFFLVQALWTLLPGACTATTQQGTTATDQAQSRYARARQRAVLACARRAARP